MAAGVPLVRSGLLGGGVAPDTLGVETEGASGQIEGQRVVMDLPVTVRNGTQQVILRVSLWVEPYLCPSSSSALASCTHLPAMEQSVPLRLMPGETAHADPSMTADLPDAAAGTTVRIKRHLLAVEDDRDMTREARENAPEPSVNNPSGN